MRVRQADEDFWRACCQVRMTFHPLPRSWRVTQRSRAMLVFAFAVPEGAVGFRGAGALAAVTPIASAASRRSVKCQDLTSHPYRLSSLLTKACQAEIGSPIPAAPRPAHTF